jgi:hypothetical protein
MTARNIRANFLNESGFSAKRTGWPGFRILWLRDFYQQTEKAQENRSSCAIFF